jgi:hypothetical protein
VSRFGEQGGDATLEVVVRGNGRQRDRDAHRRCDQRLGDAAHDGLGSDLAPAGSRRTRCIMPELLEGADHADHGTQEADERRVAADGSEQRDALLELGALERRRALTATLAKESAPSSHSTQPTPEPTNKCCSVWTEPFIRTSVRNALCSRSWRQDLSRRDSWRRD